MSSYRAFVRENPCWIEPESITTSFLRERESETKNFLKNATHPYTFSCDGPLYYISPQILPNPETTVMNLHHSKDKTLHFELSMPTRTYDQVA